MSPALPSRVAILAGLLFDDGVLAVAAPVQAAACTTSPEHDWQAIRDAIRRSTDPALALRAGARTHLGELGVAGLLLLSCASLRDYFECAARYRDIAPALPRVRHVQAPDGTLRILPDEHAAEWPHDLRRFLVEWQVMQQVTHLQDAFGAGLRPSHISFAHAAPAGRAPHAQYLGCACAFDADRTEILYPAGNLARRPRLANALAASLLQAGCDALLAQLGASPGHAGRVADALRQMCDSGVSMKRVAAAMHMTDRTLRRRLAAEGTSFSAICREVQCRIATQQLRNGGASIEEVAASSGFSDAANFRRAFIRWTSMSPAQFRRQWAG